jgi:hypothetical protein
MVTIRPEHTFTRIEKLAAARALPALERDTSRHPPALTLANSPFARLVEETVLLLPCPTEQKALLMEISPDIYFDTDAYVGQPAILIRLEIITDEELSLRLEDAWRFHSER